MATLARLPTCPAPRIHYTTGEVLDSLAHDIEDALMLALASAEMSCAPHSCDPEALALDVLTAWANREGVAAAPALSVVEAFIEESGLRPDDEAHEDLHAYAQSLIAACRPV